MSLLKFVIKSKVARATNQECCILSSIYVIIYEVFDLNTEIYSFANSSADPN
jgi:hypothetical protein